MSLRSGSGGIGRDERLDEIAEPVTRDRLDADVEEAQQAALGDRDALRRPPPGTTPLPGIGARLSGNDPARRSSASAERSEVPSPTTMISTSR